MMTAKVKVMNALADDPLNGGSISDYGRRLRRGETTIEATTKAYLDRIAALDGHLGAFEYVAAEQALACARALDQLLASGTDLGPLMGVPVGIKDLVAVEGMPITGGSRLDVTDLAGPEGSFVKRMRAAGCVILGKTKTVEFAFGAVGTNASRGTPWNPVDSKVHRIPGGSSNGSAVAVGAGLCAFAVGSDTGGSVRLPAALCGIVGLKTSEGRWPCDGVLALSPTLDTIGLLTRSVEDASVAFGVLDGQKPAPALMDAPLRFALPRKYYYDNLDSDVERRMEQALERIRQAGAIVVDIDGPDAAEREALFPNVLAPELLATLGRERFEAERHLIDPLVAARITRGLDVPADRYIGLLARRRELIAMAEAKMQGFDGWLTPTAAITAAPVADFEDLDKAMSLTLAMTQNSQPGNMFAQCGLSIPIPGGDGELPVGLQLMSSNGDDSRLLAVGRFIESLLGRPAPRDVSGFAAN
jgi:aspartyl-tRNA(Asn)/glutamyl-tRNA(Gln) amidotransferase subunit A